MLRATCSLMGLIVCVSSAMIQEVKRIIKESEIMKYGHYFGGDMH